MNRVTALTESLTESSELTSVRAEVVDTDHSHWPLVLRSIVRTGGGNALMLCDDGRLSARQTVVAAVSGTDVVGHLIFHIEPIPGRGVQARMDSFRVDPEFITAGVEQLLAVKADQQAKLRRCAVEDLLAC